VNKHDPDLHILDETPDLLLGHCFETAMLIRKRDGEYLLEDEFYGDPTCGCISPTGEWALVAGEHITVWRQAQGVTYLIAEELRSVHKFRLMDALNVQLLVDPWSTYAAIWQLNLMDLSLQKVRDFLDYRDREYEEHINL
jgi:hypothetical protein